MPGDGLSLAVGIGRQEHHLGFLGCLPEFLYDVGLGGEDPIAGLEVLPDTPLTQYLTRTLSLVYGVFGLLTIYLARSVRRYRELLIYVGWLTLLMAVALTVLDFSIGMPASWSWGEGPPTVVVALAIVWLARRTRPL